MKAGYTVWGKVKRRPQRVTGNFVEDTATADPNVIDVESSTSADTWTAAYTQIDASTAADYLIGSVIVSTADTTAKDAVVEIATGAESSEVSRIRFSFYSAAAAMQPTQFVVNPPLYVAAGTRISARVSDSEAGANTYKISVQYSPVT